MQFLSQGPLYHAAEKPLLSTHPINIKSCEVDGSGCIIFLGVLDHLTEPASFNKVCCIRISETHTVSLCSFALSLWSQYRHRTTLFFCSQVPCNLVFLMSALQVFTVMEMSQAHCFQWPLLCTYPYPLLHPPNAYIIIWFT